MNKKIVFGLMSAVHRPATIAQLVSLLEPHTVLIHHDFTQQPDFGLARPNLRWVPDPKRTGWAVWGFSEGIFHTLRHAVRHLEFDYFQLVSPTCMPIRPLAEFERHVERCEHDVHADLIDLDADEDATMTYAYRAFAPAGSLPFRLLWRTRPWYFGARATEVPRAGLQVLVRAADRPLDARARIARRLARLAREGRFGPTPFSGRLRPMFGATWFGATRAVCEHLVARYDEPWLVPAFRPMQDPDEMLFASLLGASGFRIGPVNTLVNRFDGGRPRWFESADLGRLADSPKFFARKFPDDTEAPVRRALIERLSARHAFP